MDLCCGYILGIWVFDGPCSWVAVGSGDEGLGPVYYSTGNVIAKLNTCNLFVPILICGRLRLQHGNWVVNWLIHVC